MTFAIRNRRTKKWVYGTWWQDGRVIQRTSTDMAITYDSREYAERDMWHRKCGKDYEVVAVKIAEMES